MGRVNGKVANLNRIGNWTVPEYGIMEGRKPPGRPAATLQPPARRTGPAPDGKRTADYDFYQLKRVTICNTREAFVPVKVVTS